jgi:16S rRNA (uracil1498-N3)-methyltransferase
VAVRRGALDVEVADWTTVERSLPSLVVVQALAKGGRDEDAVEAMTEVGVDEVIGWQASRSIAKWTERTAAKWTGTAESAARQSRRVWWPSVTGPASTADVVERISAADVALVLHERAETAIASIDLTDAREVLAIVGPEGGISDEELDALRAVGAQVVRLGDSVLRSSTAGVAALSVVAAHTRWR